MRIRKRRGARGLMMAASVLCYLPTATWAQTPSSSVEAKPDPKVSINARHDAADDADPTVVTVFGHRLTAYERGRTQLDQGSASSCSFAARGVTTLEGEFADHSQDTGDNVAASGTFRDNSPYGNASQPNAANSGTLPGMQPGAWGNGYVSSRLPDCLPSDYAFASGRNYILRHDTSLKQAYAAFAVKDYPKALGLFKKAHSIIGYPEAGLMMGKMYLYGLGTPRDTKAAIVWLNKAYHYAASSMVKGATQVFDPADPEAMTARTDAAMTLAKIYAVGWDVPKDPARARGWYLRADELGYIPATYLIGQGYRTGYGCTQNMNRAVSYFKRAGQVGYAPAQYTLGVIYYTGEDSVAQNKTLAAAWLTAAAKRGHAGALYAVGRMYDLGETVPADSRKAIVYYKEAAEKGDADAENALALFFYTGEIVQQDAVTARKLFALAARQGLPDAMFNLAVMYDTGEGGEKDVALAYVWMKLAEEDGLEKATAAEVEIAASLTTEDHARADALLAPPKT